jgi:CheY-like chemotaxis protein
MEIPASCNASRVAACNAPGVQLRVLIVDDSSSFLQIARMILERQGLSVVGVAASVGEGLERAEELQPDVVLVDVVLADESGFELARRLRERQTSGGPAAILISTHAEEDFADMVTDCPAAAFLPKSELSADAIHRILDARPS